MSGAGGRARLFWRRSWSVLALVFLSTRPSWARRGTGRDLEGIRLPPGFRISLFSGDVPGARSMALGPEGILFVGTRDVGKVYALTYAPGGDRADKVYVLASGLDMPNGVAFRDGSLYVAEVGRILRYDGVAVRLGDPPRPAVVTERLPRDHAHGWKFIAFGPDGRLYVPVGAPCNVCDPPAPYASLLRMKPDGTDLEVFARGIRNTVGFDWDPDTGDLWFTDNGRDMLGDDRPPDELNRAPGPGLHFGFPYRHGADVDDPEFGGKGGGKIFVPPALALGPHVAALGMRFYEGKTFPAEYQGRVFIAEHGSWNRSSPVGYRVTTARVEEGRASDYRVFADGWLRNGAAWGRPVDVQPLPDGSLLVSDDQAGAVYRITRGR